MQRLRFLFIPLLLLFVLAAGCSDKTIKVYTANLPVYQDLSTWRASNPSMVSATALQHPGKIYLYNDLLLVNEFMQGIHFYNNSNPAAPIDLGFLPILANVDMAVRNNILYVDSYTDLLSFDISDPSHPLYIARVNDVFQFTDYIGLPGFDITMPMAELDPSQGVVTGWTQGKTSEELSYYGGGNINMDWLATGSGAESSFPNTVGLSGSTARFAIHDRFLYTLEPWQLGVFDIIEGMTHVTDITLTRNSETIFLQAGYLYLGTTTGMSIYSLNVPENPSFVSDFVHVTSCDPVVVEGDKAFVTLSTGRRCNGSVNSLMVVDLADISNPRLMYEFPMTNPKGLGIDGSALFLCDGADGLKIFDKTDLANIPSHLISHFSGIGTADVIAHNQVLMMTGEAGIYQYSYANLNNIVQLSLIPIVH